MKNVIQKLYFKIFQHVLYRRVISQSIVYNAYNNHNKNNTNNISVN